MAPLYVNAFITLEENESNKWYLIH